MVQLDLEQSVLVGQGGSLAVSADDEVARKLAMLIEGECEGIGCGAVAQKYGYTRQRYTQIRQAFLEGGSQALASKQRGPRRNYRRTDEVVRQVIRYRFLDPNASPQVVAQKLRQTGLEVSTRSVERVISEYGLQKKTLQVPPSSRRTE